MGCLFVIVLGGITALMIYFFGYVSWVMILLASLWFIAVIFSFIFGHRGFGGGGNTDFMIMIAGIGITAAIIIPKYEAQRPCKQAKTALIKLADAEHKYFSEKKTFTRDFYIFNLPINPGVDISIVKADEKSFVAIASHKLCDKYKNGQPDVLIWDSAKDGLQ
ncbi:MAG: hypothetical protein LLF28_06685 [Nitrospiraceae bacterium]|nr:hypothetical protein [Nitrospiraceae bacterium]